MRTARSSSCPRCSRHSAPSRSVVENLEIAYLANRDINVGFGLLGDLQVAPTMPSGLKTARSSRLRCGASPSSTSATRRSTGCAPSTCSSGTRRTTSPRARGWAGSASAARWSSSSARCGRDGATSFTTKLGDARVPPHRGFRHHARRRHRPAARRRAQAHLHHRAPAQPRALERRRDDAYARATAWFSRGSA